MRVPLALLALLSLPACSSDLSEVDGRTLRSAGQFVVSDCEGIQIEEPPPSYAVLHDSVALPTAGSLAPALQAVERTKPDGTPFVFAKAGLYFRPVVEIEVAVPEQFRADVAIGWGEPGEPSQSFVVECSAGDEWRVIPGGFWASQPVCAELSIRADEAESDALIGIGAACPGQEEAPSGSYETSGQ